MLAEALRAAQGTVAALQLECDNAKRAAASVNEREALRREVMTLVSCRAAGRQ